MIFSILNDPVLDVVYRIEEMEQGTIHTDLKSEVVPSGKGINVARVIRALGEEVCVLGFLPENDLLFFTRYLQHHGIKSHFYDIEGYTRVNTTIVEKNKNQVTRFNSADYRLSPRVQDEFYSYLVNFMKKDDLWAITGSLPQGFDADAYMKIIGTCRDKGVIALFDAKGIAFSMGLRGRPTMVKLNISELEQYFGEQVWGVHHIALKGKRLLDLGIEYVFISLGSDGLIAIHENDCLLCSVPRIDSLDYNGCGEALVAGMLVAKNRNFSFIEACRMAAACGTAAAKQAGVGKIQSEDVWKLMEEIHIESV